jgi:hypothetical protein
MALRAWIGEGRVSEMMTHRAAAPRAEAQDSRPRPGHSRRETRNGCAGACRRNGMRGARTRHAPGSTDVAESKRRIPDEVAQGLPRAPAADLARDLIRRLSSLTAGAVDAAGGVPIEIDRQTVALPSRRTVASSPERLRSGGEAIREAVQRARRTVGQPLRVLRVFRVAFPSAPAATLDFQHDHRSTVAASRIPYATGSGLRRRRRCINHCGALRCPSRRSIRSRRACWSVRIWIGTITACGHLVLPRIRKTVGKGRIPSPSGAGFPSCDRPG